MPTLDIRQKWVAVLKGYILRRGVTMVDSQDTLQYYGACYKNKHKKWRDSVMLRRYYSGVVAHRRYVT